MYYLNSRYYNPEIDRFINADGIIGANQDLLGYNLYAYIGNNFVNSQDRTGENATAIDWQSTLGWLGSGATTTGLTISGPLGWLIVGVTATIITGVTINKYQSNKKNHKKYEPEKNQTVYTLVNFNVSPARVEYVGRTVNPEQRKRNHNLNMYRKHLTFVPIRDKLTYLEARGMEQVLIVQHKTLNRLNPTSNQINAIRWDNPKYNDYMNAAMNILNSETYVGE